MFVKKVQITSGLALVQSNQKYRWDLYSDDSKYLGSLFKPVYFETHDCSVGTYYPACNIYEVQTFTTMVDAIKFLNVEKDKDYKYYDVICDLFFNEDFTLVP